jgi:hypothetical protein
MKPPEWKRRLLRYVDRLINEWIGAFPGPPEEQMEALEFLADLRQRLTSD